MIRFWGYPVTNVAMTTLFRFLGFKACWFSQHKPMHEFLPNF